MQLSPPSTASTGCRPAQALALFASAAPFSGLADSTGHAIVAGDCAASTPPPGFERPSLRTVRRGVEVMRLGVRRLRLDEDSYIAVNGGADRSSVYLGAAGVSPLVVVFGAGALAECAADPDAGAGGRPLPRFLETLQPHGGAVSAQLAKIERRLGEADPDPFWWEERILSLLAALLDAERALQQREDAMAGLKAATRRELLRRVLFASDYIQSCYDQPISLADIAGAAHLSRFHLVRLFQQAHGLTPHAYLTRKRVTVALRLIARTPLGLNDIALRAGLGTRSSLFRHLRRQQGSGAAALRARTTDEHRPCTISA